MGAIPIGFLFNLKRPDSYVILRLLAFPNAPSTLSPQKQVPSSQLMKRHKNLLTARDLLLAERPRDRGDQGLAEYMGEKGG